MNAKLKGAFTQMKPVCDKMMVNPTPDNIKAYLDLANDMKKEFLQDLQQYMLFPIITHIHSKEIEGRHELQRLLLNAMKTVLDRISVVSFELCFKIEMALSLLAFDKDKPGMIAEIPEELKLSAIQCLTSLMLNLETPVRLKVIKTYTPLLAQAIFASVHMAKLEKMRTLRLAALESLLAHTCMHPKLTDTNCMITDPALEETVVHMLCSILPGVLATLQDVAVCPNNPGHAVVVMALNATHRIMCMTMNDKHLKMNSTVTVADIMKVIKEKENANYVSKDKSDLPKLSKQWFQMAGEKLEAVIKSVVRLGTHEHYKVRKELAVLCYRVLSECNSTMQPSICKCLDILISLSSDPYPQVANYCQNARVLHFRNAPPNSVLNALDSLTQNLFVVLGSLPRVLNNIDTARKVSSLNLLEGYIELLSEGSPQRLTSILSSNEGYNKLCISLASCAAIHTDLAVLNQHAARNITTPPPKGSPWCKFRHLDDKECVATFQKICLLLGEAECGELILDTLLDTFRERRECEVLYLMNLMASAPKSTPSLAKRVIDTYIEEGIWYLPVEVGSSEAPLSEEETLDVSIYNPRAWSKDSVPGLFEGATETRYTDISYLTPRAEIAPTGCRTLRQAQHNMVQCCLLTEGLGFMARKLKNEYQPYLLKTLCLVLERVGSRYEMLHLSGMKAINDIKTACEHSTVEELIAYNADYFTHQITRGLKKAWNTQSSLEILSVVMEYSDSSILEYMYGIVEDVLVQSCDKYYQRNLYSYLQVFHTFVSRIYKWFPYKREEQTRTDTKDLLEDVIAYVKSEEEAQRLLNESEKDSRTVEEMFSDDVKLKDDDGLDYDDTETGDKPPLPKHIEVTITILKRCINFIPTKNRDNAILTLQILTLGLPVIKDFEDELLPLVHLTWGPLVTRFEDADSAVLKRALDVLVTLAMLSKDFIRHRTLKEVLPKLYKKLNLLSADSYLKDAGSSYRLSPPFHFQIAALIALSPLTTELRLPEDDLEDAMKCVCVYLSRKQPKPLQTLAVKFFKTILQYNNGAAWLHLRRLCGNSQVLQPPNNKCIKLEAITGTPYESTNKDYDKTVKAIFDMK